MNPESLYEIFKKYPKISTDTRKITNDSIFFALKGPNFDANAFAKEALEKGAAYCVIDNPEFKLNDRCILVEDTLSSLQQLASHHRDTLNIPIIAIVGSNGKTTTKELVTSVLKTGKNVWATPGNFNNHIGLPLSLLMIQSDCEIAIIEMGANHIGENAELCAIAKPTHGIVTNNGKDHLEGFGSMEGVIQSNGELYSHLELHKGVAFVNAHDEKLMSMSQHVAVRITYAANTPDRNITADYASTAMMLQPGIVFNLDHTTIVSTLSGDYNFDNIMAAIAMGKYFDLSNAQIKQGIQSYVPSNNRSQIIQQNDNVIYMDAYNANPSSMEVSLKNFSQMPFEDKFVILGDMNELGKFSFDEHAALIKYCRSLGLENTYFVGPELMKHADASNHFFPNTQAAFSFFKAHPLHYKNIFLKGSRSIKLETLLDCF
jgi:UDP-N-acetylmuramoyl-tripeptide--D-alanyl-D-alanine ligase